MSNIPILVLRMLMLYPERTFTTRELMNEIGCDRKSIYNSISVLECSGFPIIYNQLPDSLNGIPRTNTYKWTGEILGADY